ncbi:hypothetical protein MHYP_G00326730 [Metynnis hypsauchen]
MRSRAKVTVETGMTALRSLASRREWAERRMTQALLRYYCYKAVGAPPLRFRKPVSVLSAARRRRRSVALQRFCLFLYRFDYTPLSFEPPSGVVPESEL